MGEGKNPTLAALLARPVPLNVGGIEIMVEPMGWDRGSEALEHMLPVMESNRLVSVDGESEEDAVNRWMALVLQHRQQIAAFCAVASGLPIDEIRRLSPPLAVELVMGLVEINADFFAQSLSDVVARARGRLASIREKVQPALDAATGSTTPSSA